MKSGEIINSFLYIPEIQQSLQDSHQHALIKHTRYPDLDVGFFKMGNETGELGPIPIFTVSECVGICIQHPHELDADFENRQKKVRKQLLKDNPNHPDWHVLGGRLREDEAHTRSSVWMTHISPIGEV